LSLLGEGGVQLVDSALPVKATDLNPSDRCARGNLLATYGNEREHDRYEPKDGEDCDPHSTLTWRDWPTLAWASRLTAVSIHQI
jgi:hypothetical protein